KNQADQLVYSLEKLLRENKARIPESEAENVRAEIEKTKKSMASENIDEIRGAMEALSRASHKLTEMMYQQAGPQPQSSQQPPHEQGAPNAGASSAGGADEEVIDAEVVDEDKKG
ncbi:MAG: chaperone protein DnaK, partial [Candidatus Aminicenantes bacterium]|nr:chaperone protein DnaK [Candidatus Aminicenantes bacterium]